MSAGRRRADGWSDWSRAHKWAFVQSQVLFWGLYLVVMYLFAKHEGVMFAVLVFGGSLVGAGIATFIGLRLSRKRRRSH